MITDGHFDVLQGSCCIIHKHTPLSPHEYVTVVTEHCRNVINLTSPSHQEEELGKATGLAIDQTINPWTHIRNQWSCTWLQCQSFGKDIHRHLPTCVIGEIKHVCDLRPEENEKITYKTSYFVMIMADLWPFLQSCLQNRLAGNLNWPSDHPSIGHPIYQLAIGTWP